MKFIKLYDILSKQKILFNIDKIVMIKEEEYLNCKSDFFLIMEGEEHKRYKISYDDLKKLENYLGGIIL